MKEKGDHYHYLSKFSDSQAQEDIEEILNLI